MNTLDKLYKKCFLVSKNSEIEEYDEGLIKIKNVFEDPDLPIKFQNLLSKWESCNTSKPGMMTLQLPYWTSNYVLRQLFDFECHWNNSQTEFIYFYWNNKCMESCSDDLTSNNCLLPHVDFNESRTGLTFLVNLNHRPVRTGFWKFDGNSYEYAHPDKSEYLKYVKNIKEENIDDVLNEGRLKKEFEIEYDFNEAIVYPSHRYHQPIIDKFYTRENPRILLRYYYILAYEGDY